MAGLLCRQKPLERVKIQRRGGDEESCTSEALRKTSEYSMYRRRLSFPIRTSAISTRKTININDQPHLNLQHSTLQPQPKWNTEHGSTPKTRLQCLSPTQSQMRRHHSILFRLCRHRPPMPLRQGAFTGLRARPAGAHPATGKQTDRSQGGLRAAEFCGTG